MATVFKFTDGTNELDLATLTGFKLMHKYRPKIAVPPGDGSIPEYVTEVVPVVINNSGADSLAGFMQTCHALQKQATEYWNDPTQATPVWWHQKLDGETGERRALVKSLEFSTNVNWFADHPAVTEGVYGHVVVERHPYWERTSNVTGDTLSPTSGASVSMSLSNTAGDVGARVSRLHFTGPASTLTRAWIGLRSSEKHGTVANFVNIWECEDAGFALGTDAARNSDSTASGGSKVTITPGTETWARRLTATLQGVTADYADNYGNFLWLLRAKLSAASSTWEIKFRFGYERISTNYVEKDSVEISSTSWDFYGMAIASIPLRNIKCLTDLSANYESTFRIHVYARRTSGSGALELDCICPVPIDEGYMILNGEVGISGYDFHYSMAPNEEECLVGEDSSAYGSVEAPESNRFYIPNTSGLLIASYARASESVLTDTFQISNLYYVPRWVSLRGSE